MSKKNFLSGRDKELQLLAEQYEAAKAEGRQIYLDAYDLADLIDWYALRRNYDMAIEVVSYGLELHPDSTTLLIEQAYLYIETQNREKAQKVAEIIAEDSPEVKILKANLLLGEDRLDDAEMLLDTIEEKDSLANIVDVAYMYIDMGYPEKAEKWLSYGKEQYAEEESFIAACGDCHHSQGQYEEAMACYNKLIDRNPYSAPYWMGMARCYFDQQLLDKAIEACDFALIGDEGFADAYLTKGHCFFQLGNEKEAIEAYRQAEQLNALDPNFVNILIGMAHVVKEEWEQGLKLLEKAIASDDLDPLALPPIYANAALCLYKLGKKRKAHQYCKTARKINGNDPAPYLLEGRIHMEEGEVEKGAKQWAKALECAPYMEIWYEIGIYSLETNMLNYAKAAFERVKEEEPDFYGINEKLTIVYLLLNDEENAQKYNKLCQQPLPADELEKLQYVLQNGSKEERDKVVKHIIKSFNN